MLKLIICPATGSNFLMDLPDQRHSANILSKPAGHTDDGLFSRQDTSSRSISPFSSSLGADDLPGSAADVLCCFICCICFWSVFYAVSWSL